MLTSRVLQFLPHKMSISPTGFLSTWSSSLFPTCTPAFHTLFTFLPILKDQPRRHLIQKPFQNWTTKLLKPMCLEYPPTYEISLQIFTATPRWSSLYLVLSPRRAVTSEVLSLPEQFITEAATLSDTICPLIWQTMTISYCLWIKVQNSLVWHTRHFIIWYNQLLISTPPTTGLSPQPHSITYHSNMLLPFLPRCFGCCGLLFLEFFPGLHSLAHFYSLRRSSNITSFVTYSPTLFTHTHSTTVNWSCYALDREYNNK